VQDGNLVEALKDWWKANGTSVIAGAVIGLAGLFGWRFYNEHQIAAEEAASQAYQQAVGAQQSEQLKTVTSEHADSAYALLAALNLAKRAVDVGQLPEAEKQLQFVLSSSDGELLKPIAGLRLARVLAEQQRFDEALAQLAAVDSQAFLGQVEEIKGDIYLRQGQTELARNAYQAAADAGELSGNPMLQMKLDDLADLGEELNG